MADNVDIDLYADDIEQDFAQVLCFISCYIIFFLKLNILLFILFYKWVLDINIQHDWAGLLYKSMVGVCLPACWLRSL